MVLAMKTSGFGAGWTLLGRLWCACWRGAKGTSCSHLSWCTAWGRFLSHKFCKISGFGWIGTSFPNLSLKIRTDSCCFFWQWIIQVLQKHPWRYQQLLEVGFMETNITKHHRNSQGFRWGHPPISSTLLRKFWISDLDPIRQIPVDKLNPEHFLILDPKRKSYKKNLSTYFLHQKQQ